MFMKCLYDMVCAGIRSGSTGRTTEQRCEARRTDKKLAVDRYLSNATVTVNIATMYSRMTWSSAHRTGMRPRRVGTTSPGKMNAVCSAALMISGKIAVVRRSNLSTKKDPLRKILGARLKNTNRRHCKTFRETLLDVP
jgi:hypothetical protein